MFNIWPLSGEISENNRLHKLSPEFQSLFLQNNPALNKTGIVLRYPKAIAVQEDGNRLYGAIIYTRQPEVLQSAGISIQTIWSDFITARITPAMLSRLTARVEIQYIQAVGWAENDNDITTAFKNTDGHGTHVAGTAAGNGASLKNRRFKGMAPKANLLIVKAGNGSYPTSNIIDGLSYAHQKARQLNLPVVVNMSLGSYSGARDGTDPKSQAIDEFCMKYNGRVVVASAGNDGNTKTQISGSIQGNGTTDFYFTVPEYTPENGSNNDDWGFECWFEDDLSVSAALQSPGGYTVNQNTTGSNSTESDDGTFAINNYTDINNNSRYISGYIWDQEASLPPAQAVALLARQFGSGFPFSLDYSGIRSIIVT